jgi:Domain of unknown function (DUF5060)/Protein of unknown function (DUF4038)
MKKGIAMNVLLLLAPLCFLPNWAAAIEVGKYKTHELVFTAATSPVNPFDTYLLKLELTDPAGKKFTIDGFYDGNGNGGQNGRIWKARVTPYTTGIWSWRTTPGDAPDKALEGLGGQFNCVESGDRGGLTAEGRYFRFQSGDYIYVLGNFLDSTVRFTHVYMSEMISDRDRDAIIARNRDFHKSNKINVYFANKGDYGPWSVTPWRGTSYRNDKTKMELARWELYDRYIHRFKQKGMFAQMWFLADDSGFGGLPQRDKNRLFRYAMARTSGFSHMIYVIALEWEEEWSRTSVTYSGNFLQAHNPWGRPLSVHSVGTSWAFSGQSWPSFIASQPGNDAQPAEVNRAAVALQKTYNIPHIAEEFGYLASNSDIRLRGNLWASFTGGAAGSGTGSDLRAFQHFLSQSRVPFHRMKPANELIDGGGGRRFTLAEAGRHYVVYSTTGGFKLKVSGKGLTGHWFNPRNPNPFVSPGFSVSPGKNAFTPPQEITEDWVLWITDGSNLRTGISHPSVGATLTQQVIQNSLTLNRGQ